LKLSVAVRDTCIKLLDGYYCIVKSDTIIEVTRESVSCVAVVSLFTAIKMMDPESPVTLVLINEIIKTKTNHVNNNNNNNTTTNNNNNNNNNIK
jgi:hypothetical protein